MAHLISRSASGRRYPLRSSIANAVDQLTFRLDQKAEDHANTDRKEGGEYDEEH